MMPGKEGKAGRRESEEGGTCQDDCHPLGCEGQ